VDVDEGGIGLPGVDQESPVLVRHLAADLGRDPRDDDAGGDLHAFRDDRAGGDDRAPADPGPGEDRRVHGDHGVIFDRAGVDDGPVTDRHPSADAAGPVRVDMDDRTVLDVRVLADLDLGARHIGAEDAVVPDVGASAENDPADDDRPRRHPGAVFDLGGLQLVRRALFAHVDPPGGTDADFTPRRDKIPSFFLAFFAATFYNSYHSTRIYLPRVGIRR